MFMDMQIGLSMKYHCQPTNLKHLNPVDTPPPHSASLCDGMYMSQASISNHWIWSHKYITKSKSSIQTICEKHKKK